MTIANFITYIIALAIAAAIPGLGIFALVAHALGSGFKATFPMLLGVTLGDVIYLIAAMFGLALIANSFSALLAAVGFAGAGYLLWMAVSFWRSGVTHEKIKAKPATNSIGSFLSGLFITLGNPKTIIFYIALLPTLFDLSTATINDIYLLCALTFLVLIVTLTPYIALAGQARTFLQTPNALKILNRFAAVCLSIAAIVVIFQTV